MRKILRSTALALGVLTVMSVQAQAVTNASGAGSIVLKNDQDKLSYAIGVETGRSFKSHDVQIDPTIFAQGVSDGLVDKPTLMNDSDIQKQISDFQQKTLAKMQEQLKQSASENQKKEQDFLTSNKTKPGVVTTASGLEYKIVTPGKGASPTDNDVVTVDYEGKLLNGKVFDSSYERGKPATFPVAAVIEGWQEALKSMQPGATWVLYIPSKLAYGSQGAGGVIGPNETLTFKVHLISVKPGSSQGTTEPATATSPQP
jgi:FKBP-type peptidyl-prolyl cis-trans isomerase FklB